MRYRYVKAPPGYQLVAPPSGKRLVKYYLSLILMTLGVAISTTVAYPLINYQLTVAPRLQKTNLVSPITPSIVFADEVVNTALDYTDSSTWFGGVSRVQSGSGPSKLSTLSIPKLNIEQAVVRNDHTDLKQSLIQYPGTANPGDLGNTVIFGHSVLPQFFNPQNYVTIFSTLHRLVVGDKIELEADGASYTYEIYEMYETTPDDLSPLAQSYNGRYLTLITCTPPGTYLRRLIVKAHLL